MAGGAAHEPSHARRQTSPRETAPLGAPASSRPDEAPAAKPQASYPDKARTKPGQRPDKRRRRFRRSRPGRPTG